MKYGWYAETWYKVLTAGERSKRLALRILS